jgi:hypothetical protein
MTLAAGGSHSDSPISILTQCPDAELIQIQQLVVGAHLVETRSDIEALLGILLAMPRSVEPRTLDLIGHSTASSALLQIGRWVIDAKHPTVKAFFRELADQEVLPRLNVNAVRLIGSKTAETVEGRRTLTMLAEILGVPVYGAVGPVFAANFDATGFVDNELLESPTPECADRVAPMPRATSYPRSLDVDSLPHATITCEHVVAAATASALLRTIRRDHGLVMPALLGTPSCTLALPSGQPNQFHIVEILLGYELVRVYPSGRDQPGVVYTVSEPQVLEALVRSSIGQ